METLSYTTMPDKLEKWGDGPWVNEPDKMQYLDTKTGLPCLAVRTSMGNWCGYVGVSKDHPLFAKDYNDDVLDIDLDVHGGLTFSDFSREDAPEGAGICHLPGPGEPKKVWWFGFDCAHHMDLVPSMEQFHKEHGLLFPVLLGRGSYKTLEYVQSETEKLAEALAQAK